MSGSMENFNSFVAAAISSPDMLRRFRLAMNDLAAERASSIPAALDSRQRDAIYGSIEMCFRIADKAEEALIALKGKANPDDAGGFR